MEHFIWKPMRKGLSNWGKSSDEFYADNQLQTIVNNNAAAYTERGIVNYDNLKL